MERLNGSGSLAVVCIVDCFIGHNVVVCHGVDVALFGLEGEYGRENLVNEKILVILFQARIKPYHFESHFLIIGVLCCIVLFCVIMVSWYFLTPQTVLAYVMYEMTTYDQSVLEE